MFDASWIADLDGPAACEAVIATQAELREREWQELALAAHWVVLHDPDTVPASVPGGGGERVVRRGGDGTPWVGEFACAELGMLMGTGFIAANTLIRDAVDLQHRHPEMWAHLAAGQGRVWKAREVARLVHAAGLDRDQARFVDTATTPYVDTLTWSEFTRLVQARIIEADPHAAEARRVAASMQRFVWMGQCNEHGLKTLVAKAHAGEIIYLVAMCDRIARILLVEGDADPVAVRRSKALAILANPARALAMLTRHASDAPHPRDPDPDPDQPDDTWPPGEPEAEPQAQAQEHAEPQTGPSAGPQVVDVSRLDPEKMRPRAVLYVRISEAALLAGAGVANVEHGIGPVTVQAVRHLLDHYHVTVRPVLDLAGQVPVDAYEVPHAMREALRLARPSSVFPWSRTGTSTPDLDHTRAYLHPKQGGPPGQTRIANLGPMVRFGHRIKTHGRGWSHRQPSPGVYLWRTPHGYWYRTDDDGTHPLGLHAPRPPDQH